MIGVFVPWNPKRKDTPGWIEDANGCHIWTGSRHGGYAYGWDTVKRRQRAIHRIRYEREVGLIPDGDDLDHYVCDNGPGGCCNPWHCRPASTRENVLRSNSFASVNAAKTHCPKGHPYATDDYFKRDGSRSACRRCAAEKLTDAYRAHRRAVERTRRIARRDEINAARRTRYARQKAA